MKKILVTLVAIAWVGLFAYPAYADTTAKEDPIALLNGGLQNKNNEEKTQIVNEVEALIQIFDSLDKGWDEKKADGRITKNQFDVIKGNKAQLQEKIKKVKEELNAAEKPAIAPTEPAANATDNAKKSNLRTFDYVVVAVLTLMLLIIVFMLYMLRSLKIQLEIVINHDIAELQGKVNTNSLKVNNCDESISGLKLKTGELEIRFNDFVEEHEKAKALKLAKQKEKEETAATPPAYQEKVWYGEFKKDEEGMPERLLKEERKAYSQFKIVQISDLTAKYSILTDISKDSLTIAQDACVIDGDIGYYDTIAMVEEGRLELCDDVWKIVDRVKIKLNKN